jgi:hypothetical protein
VASAWRACWAGPGGGGSVDGQRGGAILQSHEQPKNRRGKLIKSHVLLHSINRNAAGGISRPPELLA